MKKSWLNKIFITIAISIFLTSPSVWAEQNDDDEAPYLLKSGKRKFSYSQQTNDPEIKPETLPTPKGKYKIIDVHEHVESERDAKMLLKAMDELDVQRVVLMGTSKYTFTLNNKYGFEKFKENNEEIIRIANKYPDRFVAFPTIMPTDENNLQLIQSYAKKGAQGLKLYIGHGASTGKEPFHLMPLNDDRMKPIYEWAQREQFPLMLHTNLTKYYNEMIHLLEEFPYLRMCIPHFGLFKNTKRRLDRLSWILSRYPNVYTEFSYGWYDFHVQGFEKMASWPNRFKTFMAKHPDRVMWASDMVLEPMKDITYTRNTLRSYRQLIEMPYFRFFMRPKYLMRGLNLDEGMLRNIYENAPRKFLGIDKNGKLPDRRTEKDMIEFKAGLPPLVNVLEPLPKDSPYWTSPDHPLPTASS